MASTLRNSLQAEAQHSDSGKDDDEELAALRQAALMSRKTKHPLNRAIIGTPNRNLYNKHSLPTRDNLVNNFNANRIGYNNFKPRWRPTSNLIVINTVPIDDKNCVSEKTSVPKLMLPQDRWCPMNKSESNLPESNIPKGPKKFSRIRSNSDSESDYEDSDSDGNNDSVKNNYTKETKDSLDDDCRSLLTDDEIDLENTRDETNLALLEAELNLPVMQDKRLTEGAEESVEEEVSELVSRDEVEDVVLEPDETSNDSLAQKSVESSACSQKGDFESGLDDSSENTLQDDAVSVTDSDLGSCASIELETEDVDVDLLTNPTPLNSATTEKKMNIIVLKKGSSEKSHKSLPATSKNDRTEISGHEKRHSRRDNLPRQQKPHEDLRLKLKAKRGGRRSPIDDLKKEDQLRNKSLLNAPIVRSVVKPLRNHHREEEGGGKKRGKISAFEETISVNPGNGNKVRLLQLKADSTQVTVVTDVKDREEKKRSVHKRLGPYAKHSRTSSHRTDHESDDFKANSLSRTVVLSSQKMSAKDCRHTLLKKSLENERHHNRPYSERNSRSSSESCSSSDRHRSSSTSSKRISHPTKRRRNSGGRQSGKF